MVNLSALLLGTGKASDLVHNLVNISLVCIFLMVYFTVEPIFMFRHEKKKCLFNV